jgi:hypothetical protein
MFTRLILLRQVVRTSPVRVVQRPAVAILGQRRWLQENALREHTNALINEHLNKARQDADAFLKHVRAAEETIRHLWIDEGMSRDAVDQFLNSSKKLEEKVKQLARIVEDEIAILNTQTSDDIAQEFDSVREAEKSLQRGIQEAKHILAKYEQHLKEQHSMLRSQSVMLDDVELGSMDWEPGKAPDNKTIHTEHPMVDAMHHIGGRIKMREKALEYAARVGPQTMAEGARRAGQTVEQTARETADKAKQMGGSVKETVEQMGGSVKEKAEQMSGSVKETAEQMGGSVKEKAEQMGGSIKETAEQMSGSVKETAEQMAGSVKEKAIHAKDTLGEMAREIKDAAVDAASTVTKNARREASGIMEMAEDSYHDTVSKVTGGQTAHITATAKQAQAAKNAGMHATIEKTEQGMNRMKDMAAEGREAVSSGVDKAAQKGKEAMHQGAQSARSSMADVKSMAGGTVDRLMDQAIETKDKMADKWSDMSGKMQDKMQATKQSAKGSMSGAEQAVDAGKQKAADMTDRARQGAKEMRDAAGNMMQAGREKVGEMASRAQDATRHAKDNVMDTMSAGMDAMQKKGIADVYNMLKDGMDVNTTASQSTSQSTEPKPPHPGLEGETAYRMLKHIEQMEDAQVELDDLRKTKQAMFGESAYGKRGEGTPREDEFDVETLSALLEEEAEATIMGAESQQKQQQPKRGKRT